MKKLILLFAFLLLYVSGGAQTLIDERLEEPLKSIIGRSITHETDLVPLLLKGEKNGYRTELVKIEVVDSIALPAYVSSATFYEATYKDKEWYYACTIQIEKATLRDFNNTENSLAHELGHVLDLPHDEEDITAIMFVVIEWNIGGMEYNIAYNSDYTKIRWEKYFSKIKTKYKLNPKLTNGMDHQ